MVSAYQPNAKSGVRVGDWAEYSFDYSNQNLSIQFSYEQWRRVEVTEVDGTNVTVFMVYTRLNEVSQRNHTFIIDLRDPTAVSDGVFPPLVVAANLEIGDVVGKQAIQGSGYYKIIGEVGKSYYGTERIAVYFWDSWQGHEPGASFFDKKTGILLQHNSAIVSMTLEKTNMWSSQISLPASNTPELIALVVIVAAVTAILTAVIVMRIGKQKPLP